MLDPVLLQTFLAIAQTRSFTRAAERLGLRQSTVSQHIRKLEDETGRRLFVRDTPSVTMTADGEAIIEFAQSILAANEQAARYFADSELRGRVRFGASEDFVTSLLPEVLRQFVRKHPLVNSSSRLPPSDKIREAVADASSAAAKSLRRRAPSAEAGGCAGLGCSMAWAVADRPRAQS